MHRPHHARSAGLAALTAVLIAAPLALTAAPAHAVTGTPQADESLAFTARLDIGNGQRACSAALIDTQWLLTAASCFADNPAASLAVPAGKPQLKTTATIGRRDLTTTSGQVRDVVELVPHPSRDVVLARLARPVPAITPVALSSTAPAVGEELRVAGYGRTKGEWAPLLLHTGTFTVDTVNAVEAGITGQNGAAVCMGDTGGPALRTVGTTTQLVAVNSRSFQGGCFGIDAAETRTGAVNTRVDDLRDWVAAKVAAPRVTDFNCDGVQDVAVGDPKATVGGDANAGLVRVIYGGGKGNEEINQDLATVPGDAEPSDWFGQTLAVFDHNEDGCSDLVVGIPAEDIGTEADAGMVNILYGAPAGLTKGKASVYLQQGSGAGAILGAASEAGDRMGHAVAAGHTADGEPYLAIGVPGEDLGTVADAGAAFYLRGATNIGVHQDKPGVAGTAEKGDRFGTSMAASPNHLAIGSPNEVIGTLANSGGLQIFEHKLSADGIPNPKAGVDQDTEGINGAAEAGDLFGASLSMAAYRSAGALAATDSIIAVGSPGEAITVGTSSKTTAGRVVTLRVTSAGVVSQLGDIQQEADGVDGGAETGDRFGSQVSVFNTAPNAVSTASTMLMAVGIPGEDVGTLADAGAVQTFSLLGAAGDRDYWIQAGNASGLPGPAGASQQVGNNITTGATHLYIGMPNGPSAYGAVHALPWANVTGGTTAAVTTYQPGLNGIPAAGVAFGTAIR
ncbi:S1 family peptidase [Streptomyces sp. NPDC002730]|uniref:S1 family peptidase n=1 Tax=Streptomyces sp. NPDC002730 TaxID=3364662 RepID=UPI00369AF60F